MEKMLPFKFYSLFIISIFCLSVQRTFAQSRTDPKEAKAINTILGRWGKLASSDWNISGDPCSGAAIDATDFDKTAINPIIKCDCGANTNSTCNITKLRVRALNVVGTIPDELQDLPFLTNLDLRQNYLTGRFPAFIGNLTYMQYLSFGTNSLSGTIPAELGNLRNLVTLSFAINNFTGPLPFEIGNLNNLEQLYMDGCGLSGELPSSLSKLKKMKKLWASDINFTGKIPDYLGSWPNLFSLRFQGNSFVGPIPASLSKLVGMTDLCIGDIVNVTSSLAFISKMTSLSVLILRNAMISDKIPSDFLQYENLTKLDLSFNNITGTLPQSLFTLSSLAYLFLRNNSLSGNLPILKRSSITNLDLSYNQLSGSFPSWVSDKKLELNLIGNNFIITDSNSSNSKGRSTGVIVGVGVVVAIGILGFLAALGFFIFKQKQRKRRLREEDEEELAGMTNRPDTFTYLELKNATNDFNISNLLGEGGFGAVHKGKLYDGRIVAVKQLTVANAQGKRQFMAEIGTISAVQHRNLVKLYGCCIEGDKRLVVYEYLENRSLDQALFGKSSIFLDWPTRFDICVGAARGLAYLHEESSIRIVHRDVKASNILLDADLNPKISDFGLAKLYDDKKTHITTRVAGTIGYLAPEYAMRGHLTEKADVFGFGVVALEVLSGRPNADATLEEEKVYLLEWAWRLHEGKRALDLVDPKLSSFDDKQANRLIAIALLCTQASPMLRPHMSRVITMLSGNIEVPEVTAKPSYLTEYHLKDLTGDFTSRDFSKASGSLSKGFGSSSSYSRISGDTFSPLQPLAQANTGGR